MELTVTVMAEAGATERSGKAAVAETTNKAELSRLFMGGANKKMKKMGMKIDGALMQPIVLI
jgi:hypothetical protein